MAERSLMTPDMTHCIVCNSPYVEEHHVFLSHKHRALADKYNLVIPVCGRHHRELHKDPKKNEEWQKEAQKRFTVEYPELSFQEIFEKNYL